VSQYSKNSGVLLNTNKDIYEVFMPDNTTLQSADFNLQVARGKVSGASLVNLYGYQATVDGSFIPVWENATVYTYPPDGGTTMLLYSASASDTNVSVFIDGLDSNFVQQSETLVLTNGVTGVTTVKSYRRINTIRVVGTANPVGKLILSSADKSIPYAIINVSVGKNQTSMYTVPAGYTFYLNRVTAAASATSGTKILGYRVYQKNANGIESLLLQSPWVDTYETNRVVPNPYPEKTSIQWQVTSDTTSQVGIRVEGILIQNSLP